MNIFKTTAILMLFAVCLSCSNSANKAESKEQSTEKQQPKKDKDMSVYDVPVNYLNGEKVNWNDFKGKRIMFVNVASACGLTPQYEKLQAMYEGLDKTKYAFIGVPANNFLKQEPGTAEDIATFCKKNYGVDFPILEKMSVGEKIYLGYPAAEAETEKTEISPLYSFLTKKENNSVMDIDMTWNFQKIFVNEQGKVYDYVEPTQIEANVLLGKLAS